MMKKLIAMLLSLMMCLSLMMVSAQAAFIPDPGDPVIDVGGELVVPGDDGPEDPGDPVLPMWQMPEPMEEMPVD